MCVVCLCGCVWARSLHKWEFNRRVSIGHQVFSLILSRSWRGRKNARKIRPEVGLTLFGPVMAHIRAAVRQSAVIWVCAFLRSLSAHILNTYLIQFSGSPSQSVLHRKRSHDSHPIGGVRAKPFSRQSVCGTKTTTHIKIVAVVAETAPVQLLRCEWIILAGCVLVDLRDVTCERFQSLKIQNEKKKTIKTEINSKYA